MATRTTRRKSTKSPRTRKGTSSKRTTRSRRRTAKSETATRPRRRTTRSRTSATSRSRTSKKRRATTAKSSSRRYGKAASESVEQAMHERKRGTLRSGSGQKVTSRKQAIAVGLSQARKRGAKVPQEPKASKDR